MSAILKGVTVSFQAIPNFGSLNEEEAEQALYNQLVPACETSGVKLSAYGNHHSRGALPNETEEKYEEQKNEKELFHVSQVQKIFRSLDGFCKLSSKYGTDSSYVIKDSWEEKHEYCYNGDFIAAMLLKGYSARFGKKTDERTVNCTFKATLL